MYQNPAILLSEINEYANRLCALGSLSKSATKETSELRNALRVTNIQQAIGSAPVIAIAGLQGAGKSTLAAEILRIPDGDNWFPMNLGRGENLPVLVTQKEGLSGPRAYTHCFVGHAGMGRNPVGLARVEILDREKFKERAKLPEPEDVFLEIELPLQKEVGLPTSLRLLILPGFEKSNAQDSELTARQTVTKEAMSASMFTLLVMNPSQSALNAQSELFNEYLREFQDAQPLIVLSCADQDKNGNQSHRRKLLEDDKLTLNEDQVLTRGNYEASSEAANCQREALISAIHKRWASSHSCRDMQLRRIQETIRNAHFAAKDLADELEDPVDEYLADKNIERMMAPYLEGERTLTKSFYQHLNTRLEQQHSSAVESMQRDYAKHSGLDRFLKSVGDFFKGGPEPLEFVDSAKRHWAGQIDGKKAFLDVQKLTVSECLFVQNATDWDGLHASYGPNASISDSFNPSVIRSIVCPESKLDRERDFVDSTAFEWAFTKSPGFTESLRLLPVYAFENQRLLASALASAQTGFTGADHSEASELAAKLYKDLIQSGGLEHSDSKHLGSILGFGAMIFGFDVAADGQADIIHDLAASLRAGGSVASGTTVAGTSAAAGASAASCIAAGVVAVAAAGVLYGKVMHNAWARHQEEREIVCHIIRGIQQKQLEQFSLAFSRFMDLMREATYSRMRYLLGLDAESDARFHRIALMEALNSKIRQLEYGGHFAPLAPTA